MKRSSTPFSSPIRRNGRCATHRACFGTLRNIRTRRNSLSIGLLKGSLDAGIEIWTDAPAKGLVTTDGKVTGIEVERQGEVITVNVEQGIVLASGRFEWNADMMAVYFPGPVEWTASPSTNTGDGQRMAEAAGAQLDRMDQALVMGTTPVMYEGRLQGSLPRTTSCRTR